MYKSIDELLAAAALQQKPLWQVVLDNECRITALSEQQIWDKMDERLSIMEQSAARALEQSLSTVGGLIEGVAAAQNAYSKTGGICGPELNLMMAMALSSSEVNASMGKICAAPTAGACGILPAVLITVGKKYSLSRTEILQGLLLASGIGAIITRNATVSGAEGGCQAECGVAAAMAAAAAAKMAGGSDESAAHAAAFALMNCMGLICDPVAGLVQVPCAQRNASQAMNAILSADLALAGMRSIIPPDEVVEAMYRVGKLLPMQLRETALGGIAMTKTGRAIAREIFN